MEVEDFLGLVISFEVVTTPNSRLHVYSHLGSIGFD